MEINTDVPSTSLPNLLVYEHDVPELLQLLEAFLSPAGLTRKLDEVERTLRSSSPILKDQWVVPTNRVWIGFRELRASARVDFRGVADRRAIKGVLPALGLAARLRFVLPSLPPWKRDEFRARFLAKGSITPILMEIDAAAHVLLRGFRIEWVLPGSEPGHRTPEMVVRWPGGEFEIECKSTSVDAGRKISRRQFYQLCDRIVHRLARECRVAGVEGDIEIVLPARLDADWQRQEDLCEAIARLRNGGSEVLPNRVEIHVRCQPQHAMSPDDAEKRLRRSAGQFGQGLVVFANEHTTLVSCRSKQSDRIVKAIEKDLSDAHRQLSGARPARIMCYVPEVSSFEVLRTGSALQVMTNRFFDRHRELVHSVVYVSDPMSNQLSNGVEALTQGLTFRNPHFTIAFPPDLEAVAF